MRWLHWLMAALLPVLVQAQTTPERIRFSRYDAALGRPAFDAVGDVTFSGRIEVSGTLRVEDDDAGVCGGHCAYFRPDADARRRLPRLLPMPGIDPLGNIQLYAAAPLLREMSGREQMRRMLLQHRAFEIPVVLTLRDFRIYGACGGMHYEAVVVGHPIARAQAVALRHPRPASTC